MVDVFNNCTLIKVTFGYLKFELIVTFKIVKREYNNLTLIKMASRTIRNSYVSDSGTSSSGDDDYSSSYNTYDGGYKKEHDDFENIDTKSQYIRTSNILTNAMKSKCTNKNAIMARRNRMKKKIYMEKLEDEITKLRSNKTKLTAIVTSQSATISNLRKELKYMKSLMANSADIGNLVKNIRNNTGMSVRTCLDKTVLLNSDCVSKHQSKIAKKTMHSWEDEKDSYLGENGIRNRFSEQDFNITESNNDELNFPLDIDTSLSDFQFDGINNFDSFLEMNVENNLCQNILDDNYSDKNTYNEHNYTTTFSQVEECEDVGVCLHVSKHKVSLEFCSSCSENAIQGWKERSEL